MAPGACNSEKALHLGWPNKAKSHAGRGHEGLARTRHKARSLTSAYMIGWKTCPRSKLFKLLFR